MIFPYIISKVLAVDIPSVPGKVYDIPNPLCKGATNCTIVGILEQISVYLLWIGAPITAIMIIYGAFQMMTAGGNPEQFKKGSKTLLYAAVGYGIILVAWGVVSLVKELLSVPD